MTQRGAMEINKATGEEKRISAREQEAPADCGGEALNGLAARAVSESKASTKKRAERKSNERIRAKFRDAPLSKSGKRIEPDNRKSGDKLNAAVSRPMREASLAMHSKTQKEGGDNSGVQAAQLSERGAESAGGTVSAAVRKQAQKKRIKREYAKAFRTGNAGRVGTAASKTKRAAQKAKDTAKKTAAFARRHWKGIGIFLAIIAIFALLFSGLSSCGAMLSGGFNSIISSSYTSEDEDITNTDAAYTALESGLRQRVAGIESEYPGYDEYRYELDEIGHDPFELASYLTAKFVTYTPDGVGSELQMLFGQQYALTLTPITETRYRTEERTGSYDTTDPDTGEVQTVTYTYTVEVPYSYYILNVSLKNKSLGSVALANLNAEQKEMYAVYTETKGNKPYLFGDNPYVNRGGYTDYDIPPEALTDTKFAAMMAEAKKYLGYPYVWGGSSPSTSFDCSGYVSWVINHSGWNFGRLTANGLMGKCAIILPSEAKPGDLIFFQGTYDTSGASHVGIYVGGGRMIHCGNPISYADITTSYWRNHFLAYGRLP